MLITEILEKNAADYGKEIALIEREPAKNIRRQITWDEFNSHANSIANSLIAMGIKKQDKVIQLMMNALEWLPVYFGILRSGAWAVPLNFRLSADDIMMCAETAQAKVFIFGEEFIDRINSIKACLDKTIVTYIFVGNDNKCPDYARQYEDIFLSGSIINPKIEIKPSDSAALYFTSGTTSRPKAVLLNHRNLEFACLVENHHHNQTHDDNFLCIPPLYHTRAKMHWFGNFIVGAKSVILKGVSPKWILETISEERATIVWLLVPWAHDILVAIENNDINLSDYKIDQWRLMHIGDKPGTQRLIKK